jgi:hypothetical protein
LDVLEEDEAYLEQLAADPAGATVPGSRFTSIQRGIHADNVARLTGVSSKEGPGGISSGYD